MIIISIIFALIGSYIGIKLSNFSWRNWRAKRRMIKRIGRTYI